MTISAKIIADSVNPLGSNRLTTFELRYPRFIHAELMTHRVFSRNASSSRAIPVERLIADIIKDTAMPIHWGKNQKGMQADEEHNALVEDIEVYLGDGDFDTEYVSRETAWLIARDNAILSARKFTAAGYHKQIVNRLLEPFSHINVVVTSTEYQNWFALRNHPDAQPEIRELARQMLECMRASKPFEMAHAEWHLPYVDAEAWDMIEEEFGGRGSMDIAKQVSAARCARVSYKTHDGKTPTIEADIALYERLAAGEPKHASPLEHQAMPLLGTVHAKKQGNFNGWVQFRKFIAGENSSYDI